MSLKVLDIENLSLSFQHKGKKKKAIDGISFSLKKGEILGIVGESGSGKSMTALSILGLVPDTGTVTCDKMVFSTPSEGDFDLKKLSSSDYRKIRGKKIAMIFQEPSTSLNPVFTCGNQVREMFTIHQGFSRKKAKNAAIELFKKVDIKEPEKIYHSFPHEVSGGQKQRVMIAMAMSCSPDILLADEPTTALDVTIQKNVLELMRQMRDEMETSIVFISHDLGVIAEIADRILVMHNGKIVEEGSVFDVYTNPRHPYTKGLLACRPRLDLKLNVLPTIDDFVKIDEYGNFVEDKRKYKSVGEALLLNAETKSQLIKKRIDVIKGGPLIRIRNLKKYYPIKKGLFGKITGFKKAVDGISIDIYPGETVGLVGESGCGKTTLGRTILKLVDSTDGKVFFEGNIINLLSENILRPMRKDIQIIFQDPYSSLNPKFTIGQAIIEPMKINKIHTDENTLKENAIELLKKVNLDSEYFYRYPHQLSGGQRQRACIARVLGLKPKFIVCDESVSALDVSVQAQVLNLLNDLKKEFNLTYLFISHDLSVVKFIADRILVMKDGKLVEMGYPDALFERPRSEYTKKLISSIPHGDPEDIQKAQLKRKIEERN